MADALVYLYAVGDYAVGDAALDTALPPGLTGVGGAPVRVILGDRLRRGGQLRPVQFNEESLQRSLEDLSLLAATARAHHGVIETVRRRRPVAPPRLATDYLDDENVRGLLDANEEAFAAALDRIRGRSERVSRPSRWRRRSRSRSRTSAREAIPHRDLAGPICCANVRNVTGPSAPGGR